MSLKTGIPKGLLIRIVNEKNICTYTADCLFDFQL